VTPRAGCRAGPVHSVEDIAEACQPPLAVDLIPAVKFH